MNYREKAIRIGKSNPLMGVLTEPAAGTVSNGHGVVLLNAGLLHRVGPSRLHVQIARRLAPLGYQLLRFDFSGIGDSDVRRDGLAFEQSAVLEVQDAMDFLATKGARSFTLMGLCSGADAGFLSAVADTRVNALVQLDPWIYHTWKYKPYVLLNKLHNRKSWSNLLTGETLRRRVLMPLLTQRQTQEGDENIVVAHYARDFPPKAQVQAQLHTLLERQVRMLNIFSGGMPEHVSYQGQYQDCFSELNFQNLLTEHYDGSAHHIFSAQHHQKWVLDLVSNWMSESKAFPAQTLKAA
jgi:pimeloyl-ACP methyl ester carboxylesterase